MSTSQAAAFASIPALTLARDTARAACIQVGVVCTALQLFQRDQAQAALDAAYAAAYPVIVPPPVPLGSVILPNQNPL